MEDLQQTLNDSGYVCQARFASAVIAALHNKPVSGAFLTGPIGTGKTYLTRTLADILGRDLFFYQCFPGTREDDLLVKLLPSEKTVSGVAMFDGTMLQAMAATLTSPRPVVLVLDEWDKTRPSADAFLLDFLQTGRVVFAGKTHEADLERLTVFLTLNVEREISETLLRRMPKIQFEPLSPNLVLKALRLTHQDHPYLYNAAVLYERCLMAEMPKPATIQELRQFLDAVALLGSNADWDALVYQFITKTEENHELLRQAESRTDHWQKADRPRLNPEVYGLKEAIDSADNAFGTAPAMPRLYELRDFAPAIDATTQSPDLTASHGLLVHTETAYNELVRLVDEPGDSPDVLGDLARVHDRYLNIVRELPLCSINELNGLWGEVGEILLTEPLAGWEDVKALTEWAQVRIVKYSKDEILLKSDGIDLRWKPESGAEIIVNLARKNVFQHIFGEGWGRAGSGKWIGRNGRIFLRHLERDKG